MSRILTLLLLCFGAPVLQSEESVYDPEDFLASYCWECHDDLTQEGDRRLDDLLLDPGTDILMAERWEEVMHQLQLGEMPPADADQPSEKESKALVAWVRGMSDKVRAKTKDQSDRVTHRRLNRWEYLHTVRDLFGIEEGDFDPTTNFPADNAVEGFRNNGHALQTSPQLIEQYFRAADEVIDYVYGLVEASANTEPQTWALGVMLPKRVMVSEGQGIRLSTAEDGSQHISLAHGLGSHDSTYDAKLFFKDFIVPGVTQSGWYSFTVEASGANRMHPYGDALEWSVVDSYYATEKEFYDQSRPIQLGIGTQFGGTPQERTRTRPNLRVVDDLPDNEFVTRTYRVWLDAGSRPYLAFVNGPPKGVKMQFTTNRLWEFDKTVPRIKPEVRNNLTDRAKRNALYYDRYRGPEVQIRHVEMKGPFFGEEPATKEFLFGKIDPDATTVKSTRYLQNDLSRLAREIFRSPQSPSDFAVYAKLIEEQLASGKTYKEALRPVLKAFLCSSSFLYLTERERKNIDEFSPQEIANRLSYFLHASMPAAGTRERLSRGAKLPETLQREVDRLLDDEKAERFFRLFAEQWLGLDKLGSMPPGTSEFPAYYIHELEESGKEETYRLLNALIRENRPVTDLVDANFTFLNQGLATLYGIPFQRGSEEWQRVALPSDSIRRGLPGQASVLTVSANGVDTSPIVRGVWVLEKIFGTPPPPPPPDVPPIEPDIRGAKTIRELVDKHREVKACATCHENIDPLGYPFEIFDPIGGFRETYEGGVEIDTTGEYRGEEIADVNDVRKFLVDHPELLTHHLAEKMLTYALGRELGFQDGDDLDALIADWKKDGLGMRDLIKRVVISEPFLSP